MTITISDTTPRIEYTVGGSSTTVFAVPFEFFDATDLKVYVGGTLKSISTHYSVSGGNGATGSVTLGSGVTSTTVVIYRDMPISRTANFPVSDAFSISSLNTEMAKHVSMSQQLERDLATRVVRAPIADASTISLELPAKADRVGKLFGFDSSTGSPEATTGRVNSVTVNTSTLDPGADATGSASFVDSSGALTLALGLPRGTAGPSGGTDVMTTRGDIITRNASSAIRLAVGSANQVIKTDGTDVSWGQVSLTAGVTGTLPVANGGTGATSLGDGHVLLGSGTGAVTPLDVTAKGSILVGDGSGDPRALGVGTNTHVLTADSGEASGLKWAAASGGKLTTEFISSATDITADSVHTFSHSLGARPSVIQVYIKCTSTDAGYAVGDYVQLAAGNGGSIDCGYVLQADATNVEVILGACIRIHNQSTFNEVSANLSNWDFVIVAYKGGTV